ncbi:Hypothetical predicted protein [Mytilus galloprovincialis]|uniref:Tyr recombinase domain-containing protein n=1 Tax=Mytilus galloprovincialis TaxID=29158 RepID=A0A8B6D4T0_MYTGA|nr:Hypothetical predicted protein [Mytilus galloprovincialis]
MPSFLGRGEKQHSVEESNTTRLVTKLRWIVESINGPRFIVDFYESYLKAIGSGVFYRKPLISDVQDKHCCGKSALGVNKLNGLMREMCEKGGLVGNFTNHSGKRTCATALYQAGIDEQQIMERTGHRSTKGVRTYKTANSNIQKRCLEPPVRSCYE